MARPMIESHGYGAGETDDSPRDFSPAVQPRASSVEVCKDDVILVLTVVNLALVVVNVWLSYRNSHS